MEIGYIKREELEMFLDFLLPESVTAIMAGEPLTVLGVVEDQTAVAALAGYLDGMTYKITSLYVAPEYRRQGKGRKLLETLWDFFQKSEDVEGMEISFTVTDEEHRTLQIFCEHMGFRQLDDRGETLYRFKLTQVADSPLFKGVSGKVESIRAFAELDQELLLQAQKEVRLQNIPLSEEGLVGEGVDQNLSYAYLEQGEVTGFVVFDHSLAGWLTLSGVWMKNGRGNIIPILLRHAFGSAREHYPEETMMAVQAVNGESTALVNSILPEAEPFSFTYVKEW